MSLTFVISLDLAGVGFIDNQKNSNRKTPKTQGFEGKDGYNDLETHYFYGLLTQMGIDFF